LSEPWTNSPAGRTTISGHSGQSTNTLPTARLSAWTVDTKEQAEKNKANDTFVKNEGLFLKVFMIILSFKISLSRVFFHKNNVIP
jgi:hypothetical protein